jgi:hypothetical protein
MRQTGQHVRFVPEGDIWSFIRSLRRQARLRAASGHSKNCRCCVGIFLKEHHPSLIVFENVDPVVLYGFACFLCPRMTLARFRILHSNQLFPRTQLPVDVGESRFEDITDWLPRAAIELN